MYAESTDGIVWEKPALNLIPWGSTSTDSCTRIGRGQCITGRSYPKCLNGSLGGGDLARVNLTFPQAVAYCRQNARCQGFTAKVDKCSVNNSTIMNVHFKDGYGASRLTNTKGWSAWRDNAKGSSFGVVNGTNIVSMNTGGDGVVYDVRDVNESRRYKLFGGMDFHLCDKRPSSNVAVDGTAWPPCHLTGVDYSADGIHFEHGFNESTIPASQFYDIVGQNDGTLDVAIYDEHLGHFWGLVRVDAGFVGRPGISVLIFWLAFGSRLR